MAKTVEEYLKHYSHCPHCDGEYIEEASTVGLNDNKASQEMMCNTCGAHWIDEYTLSNYTMLSTPPMNLQVRWVINVDGNVQPATAADVNNHTAFVGLYKQDPNTKQWEWLSDYADADLLFACTGIATVPYPRE